MPRRDFSDDDLVSAVPKGDVRAISRLITLAENGIPRARTVLKRIFSFTGKMHVVGVTGSPGAGKSTLVDQIAKQLVSQGKKVGILAVDPSSPFTGGAVLGDRIRMVHSAALQGIFIRSMATRGSLGGLSGATFEALQVLDAAGFDLCIIETVGVGQSEVDITRLADSCVVVMVPGMGDQVQTFKAGILEIADLFVINKSDRDGAELLERDLFTLLSLADPGSTAWTPPVLKTVATTGAGVEPLLEKLSAHQVWLKQSKSGEIKRRQIIQHTILRLASSMLIGRILSGENNKKLDELITRCIKREIDPFGAAEIFVQ